LRCELPSCSRRTRASALTEPEEETMSDEKLRKRKEHDDEEPDVEAHSLTIDDPNEDDPERKRKRKEFEDSEDDEFGRKRK